MFIYANIQFTLWLELVEAHSFDLYVEIIVY